MFHHHLRGLFSDRKGKTFVEHGTYSLSLKDSGQIVHGSQWEQQICSGQWLVMSALLRRSVIEDECPNCKTRKSAFALQAPSPTYKSEIKW